MAAAWASEVEAVDCRAAARAAMFSRRLAVAREWLGRGAGEGSAIRGHKTRHGSAAGSRSRLESLETIRSAGLKGMGPLRLARNLALLAPALWDSAVILRRHKFDVAFGVGGYAAGPVMLMAVLSGMPTAIFEPNAEPGFTNRVLADMATRMAVGYPSVAERLGSRAVVTGCPVRPEFFDCPPRRPAPPYRILITGGSQGSHKINVAVTAALQVLAAHKSRLWPSFTRPASATIMKSSQPIASTIWTPKWPRFSPIWRSVSPKPI